MRELITEWADLADDYEKSLDSRDSDGRASWLDYASKAQADAANESGRAYLRYLAPVVHRRTTQVMPGLLIIAALATGCATDEPGRPTSGDTTTTTTSGDPSSSTTEDDGLPSHGTPAVAVPLDTSAFEQNPCQMLTDEQVRQAGLVPPGELSNGAAGPACAWHNNDTEASAHTGFENVTRRGISAAYHANEIGRHELWDVLPEIEGYPAVVAAKIGKTDPCPSDREAGSADREGLITTR